MSPCKSTLLAAYKLLSVMASSDNTTYVVTFIVHTHRAKLPLHSHITCRPGSCIPIFCTENTEEYSSYVHDLHAAACRLTCLNIMVMGSGQGGSSNIIAAGRGHVESKCWGCIFYTHIITSTHTSLHTHTTHMSLASHTQPTTACNITHTECWKQSVLHTHASCPPHHTYSVTPFKHAHH